MNVTGVHAGPRLAVVPPVFARTGFGAHRRTKAIGVARGQLATVNCRVMKILVVAARRVRRAFESDDPAQLMLVLGRELQHDRAAHRAAENDGTGQIESRPDCPYQLY